VASGVKEVARNKKARHNYELMEFFEAGLALQGSEVKSLREGRISFKDGYVDFRGGEAWLVGVYIAPYENAGPLTHGGHDPERRRKLLLHAREIKMLRGRVEQRGLTVGPTRCYFKNGRAKMELALARGKQTHDKRETLKRRAQERDMERALLRRR
jgi:SsrA-binding protein